MADRAGWRRGAALALCFFGMAPLDHGIAWLAACISGPLPAVISFSAYDKVARARQLITDVAEPAALVLLILLALRLALPHGLRGAVTRARVQRDLGLLLGILLSLAAGRSFLGIGKGFSADFGQPVLICGLAALCLNQMITQRVAP